MGKTISQFDAPWTNYPANNFDGLVGGSGTSPASTSSPTLRSSATACRRPSRRRTRSPTTRPTSGIRRVRRLRASSTGVYGVEQHRRHAGSRHRRSGPRRPGLGSVPVLGGGAQQPRRLLRRDRSDRSSGRQVGLGCPGCLADQEHSDRRGRHDQLAGRVYGRCEPLQLPEPGCDQLLDVRQHRPGWRLPEHRLCRRIRCRVSAPAPNFETHQDMGLPRWLQPQLGSLLEHWPLRRLCTVQVQRHGQGL